MRINYFEKRYNEFCKEIAQLILNNIRNRFLRKNIFDILKIKKYY